MTVYEQKQITYIQSYTLTNTSANPITSGNAFIDSANFDEMTIYPEFTAGTTGDILSLAVSFASQISDGDSALVFHPESDEVVAAGIATILPKSRDYTSLGTSKELVPVISIPVNDRFLRIFAKDDASGTAGVLRLRIILSKIGS